ncbi:hypothetical protein EG329_006440 [Mollisiaceae sp. DMI_Dod_QoI]|nr:hypothetical protein EG329_006440 [Helotiales sp. DMI_Dod_QoI]
MSSSIWTQSTQDLSLFSHADSCFSANTQWTSEAPTKLDHESETPLSNVQQVSSKQTGRPRNKWTAARLRKLIKLYLLTELELDGIIDCLWAEDFQPCKRNVQEKLGLLLQPQPRTIRPKGDTKVLRDLLLECSKLQEARRRRKRHRRQQFGKKGYSHKEGNHIARSQPVRGEAALPIIDEARHNRSSTTTVSGTATLLPSFDGDILSSTEYLGSIAPSPWVHEGSNRGLFTPVSAFDSWIPTINLANPISNVFASLWNGDLPEFESSQLFEDSSYLICPSSSMGISEDKIDFHNPPLDIGFDSDFGQTQSHLPLNTNFVPSESEFPKDFDDFSGVTDAGRKIQDQNGIISAYQGKLSTSYASPLPKYPVVNSTYLADASDGASSFLSLTDSFYEFDPSIIPGGEMELCGRKSVESLGDAGRRSPESSLLEFEDQISNLKHRRVSNPPSSTSKISTLLSKMSLTPPSTAASGHNAKVLSSMLACPVLLPGVFPEYCWHHINLNTLRRCISIDGNQECKSKRYLKLKPTHRPFCPDVLARITQRNVQPRDINEKDTFGNSVLHISTATLAPSTYLVSLINLGANVNWLNNAGQTFMHLVKPELLDRCADFCLLLEVLSDQGFNFSQHDHLGQSPLHLLMRPWISSEILHRVITKIASLPIHSQLSTARDCLSYTIVGELNLQETSSSWKDVDQAILSLACETDLPIANSQELQPGKERFWPNIYLPKSDQLARNYENHPPITSVDDLVQYEQHVDEWRTILAAKQFPWFEDSNGRNGLHCLAAASLVSNDKPLPDYLLAQLNSFKLATECKNDTNDRQCFLDRLLDVGVDPNNYDKAGNTPLMAFIFHHRRAESEEATTQIMNSLLKAGSDINRRSRQGETALHLAVKLGCRAATKALLVAGANVHARTSGLGVLELGQKHARESKEDVELYGQIMLCVAISASSGAVAKPTILDEWGSHPKIPTESRRERKGFSAVKNFIVRKARRHQVGKP